MPQAPPTGAPGPIGGAPPVQNPTPGDVGDALSVEQTWHNLMKRRGVWLPQQIQSGATILTGVDRITKRRSK